MEALKARWPQAIARVWNIDADDYDVDNGPGKQREHVFDTDSGFRFIVSREKYAALNNGKPHIHVSVSFRDDSEVGQVLKGCKSGNEAREMFLHLARDTFAESPADAAGRTVPRHGRRDSALVNFPRNRVAANPRFSENLGLEVAFYVTL